MTSYVTRFSVRQRFEHWTVMILFLLLCATGLPQKYFDQAWAAWLLAVFGGVDAARWIHRACGFAFGALVLVHTTAIVFGAATGRTPLSMVPTRQDFADAVATLRYYAGLSDAQARFDRYDYRQKFEYWGMVMGGILMVVTGLVLYFPTEATQYLPGVIIPVSLVAHSNEGLMAFLIIIIWHIYNAHLSPDVFPFDTTIFTGRISVERMKHEHPLEYERTRGKEPSETRVA
ncbi:MAG: formate dehydrogenase subunit gamma [Betaproteobacteria bacterium]